MGDGMKAMPIIYTIYPLIPTCLLIGYWLKVLYKCSPFTMWLKGVAELVNELKGIRNVSLEKS